MKGLISSFKIVVPNSAHRICIRHLYANFRSEGHKCVMFKKKLWRAVAAYTVHEFQREMDELKRMSEPVHDYLVKADPSEWARAFFDTATKCDLLMNNICECFNLYIIKAETRLLLQCWR
jgi:hypothetical protein